MNPEVVQAFFDDENLPRSICVLCEGCKHPQDPISAAIRVVLSSPLQLHFTAMGWQPFKGKDLTFPYSLMTAQQRQAMRALFSPPGGWFVYEHALVFRPPGPASVLKPLDVLAALCRMILESSAYPDKRLRVAICNILLQRIQASVPLDKGTQAELNARLFRGEAQA